MANISKGKLSVIMVGVSVAARIIFKNWKTPKAPQFKEWVNMMIKTASYECMLYKLNTRDGTTAPDWEPFWSYITITVSQLIFFPLIIILFIYLFFIFLPHLVILLILFIYV